MHTDKTDKTIEIRQLTSKIAALEELLEEFEQNVIEQSSRIEKQNVELARSRDQLVLLANIATTSPNIIILVDINHRIKVWNAAAQKLLGWAEAEILGLDFFEHIIPRDELPAIEEVLKKITAEDSPPLKSTSSPRPGISCLWN